LRPRSMGRLWLGWRGLDETQGTISGLVESNSG
jgi:hypothetical protein